MAIGEEITKAVGAHGMWKQRLREAVDTGKSDLTVERVRPDNLCDFGKWLYSLPPGDQKFAHWKTVRDLRSKFHAEAARVLGLAVRAHKQEAEHEFGAESKFTKISSELTAAMMKWKESVQTLIVSGESLSARGSARAGEPDLAPLFTTAAR